VRERQQTQTQTHTDTDTHTYPPFPSSLPFPIVLTAAWQALADAAAFITDLKSRLGEETKFVTFGGSYSGALSGWFRLKYPHLAVGAVATSAPVLAQLNFVAYHEVVADSLRTTTPVRARIYIYIYFHPNRL
jgi:pimeloyl-ACP methyl ester carboxylesterase